MTRIVEIGKVKIGEEYPVRIAAEIGTYFSKDTGLAREYIQIAKDTGCDFLKGEVLHDTSILHDATMPHTYMTDKGMKEENYLDLLKRKTLSLKDYEKIFKVVRDLKMPMIASVYDREAIDFFVSVGGSALKVASQNLTNRPLIEHCAQSGLPLIMDTGNGLLSEIAAAVEWAEKAGVKALVLHHRPDGSPCPPNKHNLRILKTLATFNWPVGLSCHYDGDELMYTAIGLGARVIEKPMYHKKERDDQDTMFTLYFEQFKEVVKKIRNCSDSLGASLRTEQIPYQLECRACVAASKNIPAGTKITLNNVRFPWPMHGIPASQWKEVEGAVVNRAIKEGEPIQFSDIKRNK